MLASLSIASDHAGYPMKLALLSYIRKMYASLLVEDMGTHTEASCDYSDFAHQLAAAVHAGKYERGILLCGSANGVAMVANKYPNIRAAIAWSEHIAQLARAHNDANILCIPARFVTIPLMEAMVHTFLHTHFEGGRHARRVENINKIRRIEN